MALVELGRFPPPEAHIVVGRLEDEGIMAFAFDAGASVIEGSMAFFIPVRVMVDDTDLDAARAIVANPA
ncbi:DUF2007 domain-containing protein [Sphingomonas sp. AOB5]|uniref:putative signal transducing protein n=1 Tax=Sphingomonas sp. AOB5 TaxID=3034017 RepID=UPI0023FA16CD|nr:DUF2007 domain-containing protein [Sphingomonas sp. AOB5]MDF7776500.1 DUF2007 domain-containing protein [Sphingomonas sp. AOB5]